MKLPVVSFIRLSAGIIVLALGALVTAQPKSSGAARPFKPVQPLEQMMHGQKALMDDLKDAIVEKNWDVGRDKAWILAEMANVNHYQRDHSDYRNHADRMSQQCAELATLFAKRDEAGVKSQVNKLGATCNACHDQFKKD